MKTLIQGRLYVVLALLMMLPGFIMAQEFIEESGTVNVPGFGNLYKEMIWKRDNSRMILIPGGTYKIGRPRSFGETTDNNESPEVTITISPFYIDKYEVTNAQYNNVAKYSGLGLPQSIPNEALLEDDKPIMAINFDDAEKYAIGVAKDLPTEAEWEIAARGPQGSLYPYGDKFVEGNAHLNVGTEVGTINVGSNPKDISGFGVHDMGGNVSEWVRDYYERDYYKKVDGKTDPVISKPTESVSVRGGNYSRTNDDGRATTRKSVIPIYSREEVGFRTVFRIEKQRPTPTPTPVPPTPTPTPDPQIKVDQMKRLLDTHFRDASRPLPAEYVRLGAGGPGEQCVFFNQSPFEVVLGFIDPENQLAFRFPTKVPPYSSVGVTIPTKITLNIFAYAPEAPYQEVIDLGVFTADSQPLIILPAEGFTTVYSSGDEVIEPVLIRKATQYYLNNYQPDWNILEFFNDTDRPIEVTLARENPDGTTTDEYVRSLDANQVARFDEFPGLNLRLTAKYLGADGEDQIHTLSFRNDSKRDRQFIKIKADQLDEPYRVFGERVYPLDFTRIQYKFPQAFKEKYFLK